MKIVRLRKALFVRMKDKNAMRFVQTASRLELRSVTMGITLTETAVVVNALERMVGNVKVIVHPFVNESQLLMI